MSDSILHEILEELFWLRNKINKIEGQLEQLSDNGSEIQMLSGEVGQALTLLQQLVADDTAIPEELQISQQGAIPVGQINGIAVGAVGNFTTSALPVGTVLPTNAVIVWTSSDTANTSLTPSASGLSVAVALGASAPVGGSTTLNVTATGTNADGSALNVTGSATVPYLAGTVSTNPSSLDISQTS